MAGGDWQSDANEDFLAMKSAELRISEEIRELRRREEELRRLRGFWNFGCRFFLSDETQPECGRHGESVCFSKLTVQRLQEEVANLQPEVSAETTAVFVCGPKPFESDVKNSLREMGWPQVHVF